MRSPRVFSIRFSFFINTIYIVIKSFSVLNPSEVHSVIRGGGRLRKTIGETIKNDFEVNNLSRHDL